VKYSCEKFQTNYFSYIYIQTSETQTSIIYISIMCTKQQFEMDTSVGRNKLLVRVMNGSISMISTAVVKLFRIVDSARHQVDFPL